LSTLMRAEALARPVSAELARWLAELERTCRDLGEHAIAPAAWQARVEVLLGRVTLEELLRAVDLDRFARHQVLPDRGVAAARARFPALRAPVRFAAKLFGMRRGRAIVPHGHENMVSAHLLLRGELRARHYHRLADEPKHLVLVPTVDRVLVPGD